MVETIKFLDTNALLNGFETDLFTEIFLLSSISLMELEHIKTSVNKSEDVKYRARKVVHFLDEHPESYSVVYYTTDMKQVLDDFCLEETPDNKICVCCYCYSQYMQQHQNNTDPIIFVSDDLCCKLIAKEILGLQVSGLDHVKTDDYSGYLEKIMSEEEMAYFYEHMNENIYDLLTNQYLIIQNSNGELVDKYRWTGHDYAAVKYNILKSNYFGTIKPFNNDVLQQCALNSFANNQITMIKGPAGTGKSYLAMGYLFHLLEKHKIDKIIVFCNTIATKNSAKLGYYPGSRDEKLLDSQIGNMLGSKLGGIIAVEQLIQENKLILLPLSDIRGYDTTGMNAGIYLTEAQNLDISLMKLALQRIGEDSICIIDGDYNAQVDLSQYAGANNGMRRMSEVFRGQDFYGEIELKNIYRSRIAQTAEAM